MNSIPFNLQTVIQKKYTRDTILHFTAEEYHSNFDEIFQFALSLENKYDQTELLTNLMAVATQYISFTEWYSLLNEVLEFYHTSLPKHINNLHRELSLQHLRLLENVGEQSVLNAFNAQPFRQLEEDELGLKIMAQAALFVRVEKWEEFKWIALEVINHALENGRSEATAFGCLALAKHMIARYENVPIAVDYAKVALNEVNETNDKWLISRFKTDYAMSVLPWAESSERSLLILEDAFKYVKGTKDVFQTKMIKLRYLQFLVFCGYSLEKSNDLVVEKFGDNDIKAMPEIVKNLLQLLQLSSITKEDSKEKVIMILDNEPSLYEGTLLHPMLLLLKAVHLTSVRDEERDNKLQALRRILDRFKYWAGYSHEVFQCWVHFIEAEWRWESEEFDKADELYKKAQETISSQQNDMKCLICLRQLSQWFKKEGKTEKTIKLFQNTLKQYEQFGDLKAIDSLKERFEKLL